VAASCWALGLAPAMIREGISLPLLEVE